MNKKMPAGKRPAPSAPPARAATAPQKASAASGAKPGIKVSYARQDDQSPAASLDATWANLHPARIWPD